MMLCKSNACHQCLFDHFDRSEVLRRSARQEFEAARHERDPEVIARLIFVGHDCLNKTRDKVRQPLLLLNSSPLSNTCMRPRYIS